MCGQRRYVRVNRAYAERRVGVAETRRAGGEAAELGRGQGCPPTQWPCVKVNSTALPAET